MVFHKTECPHCGNEITVHNGKETQKCCWCRRLMSVKIQKTGKKKFRCEVEAIDFPEEQKKNYSKWKDEDIYGRQ